MKLDFTEMSILQLRAYVLEHRHDDEAIRALFNHPNLKWLNMGPLFTKDGNPIEENIHQAEETFRQHLEKKN
ncbi:hypothetical protein [Gloeocapsa sp. PCC 73106]|uniref:DUF6887 family protein n=1 Tax=Gloeocapsa sp. PCC 73106 TaxID=102232 RepID=UPI0002ABEAEA|nr:hypothetical protein [Gloeocapsa sp. PCC 73106]ELR99504.1 hypothetical protein GLO73106DRAFT_00033560 [Gloeocapsa sp. PCC 73106]